MLEKRLTINDWAKEDRPREKMLQKGIAALSDAELLAILIGSGNKDETAVELSRRILSLAKNNLNELGRLSVKDLIANFKGVGEAKAITIVAAMELGRRRKLSESLEKASIRCSKDIFELFQPLLADLAHEEIWLLLLNRANKVITQSRISTGGTSGSVVDIKMVLKNAINNLASSVAICHNHPSGNPQPSREDIHITTKLRDAFKAIDIPLIDHIIIAHDDYYSFADEEKL